MPLEKSIQLKNLENLGVDSKKLNGVMVGITACSGGLDTVDQTLSRLGKIKGEISEKLSGHASIKTIDELHQKAKILLHMCRAAEGFLELVQENTIDAKNPGDMKLKPEFISGAKALGKVERAGGPPDIEALVQQINVLLTTGMPKKGLQDRSLGYITNCTKFFSSDPKLLKLVGNIGGPGTLDVTFSAMQKMVETVRTPANPLINPTGTNPKPGDNTPD